jgi:cell division cycle 2-like protein
MKHYFCFFAVMDFVEHDLKSLMDTMREKQQVFLPGEIKCLMLQLLRAIAYLHDNWILHRFDMT